MRLKVKNILTSILFIIIILSNIQFARALNSETTINYSNETWPFAHIDLNQDGNIDYIIQINPWNIYKADGTAQMTFDINTNTLSYSHNLYNIQLRNPSAFIHSYPEIFVGEKPWDNFSARHELLPAQVKNIDNLKVALTYTINNSNNNILNLAFETWLIEDKHRNWGVKPNEIEIMVWFYHNRLNPAGQKVGTFTTSAIINGVKQDVTFEVWKAYIGWHYYAYKIITPLNGITVEFDFADFIKYTKILENRSDYDNLYIQGIEVGTENGSPQDTFVHFSYEFKDFYVSIKQKDTDKTLPSEYPTAPDKFRPILGESWLQLFTSSNRKEPLKYQDQYFNFINQTMNFFMCGSNKRIELRHKPTWQFPTYKQIHIKTQLIPETAKEFTFFQILSKDDANIYRPLLRLHYDKQKDGKNSHLWATQRLSLYTNQYRQVDLGYYTQNSPLDLKLHINGYSISIYRDGQLKAILTVPSYWRFSNFFKYGVYIQDGGCARVNTDTFKITELKKINPTPIVPPTTPTPTPTPTSTPKPVSNAQFKDLPNSIEKTSEWNNGFCAKVRVTNPYNYQVKWRTIIKKDIKYKITKLWNANYRENQTKIYATGKHYNNVLAPHKSTTFGFCAKITDNTYKEVNAQLSITSQWNSGFCAQVKVHNTSAQGKVWKVKIPYFNINNIWNASCTPIGKQLECYGVDWNRFILPGQTLIFGFCAKK